MTFQPANFPRPVVRITSFAFWIFVVLSGELYGWYLKLPTPLVWSVAGGSLAIALFFGAALLTWPDVFQNHLEDIRATVKGVQETLIDFLSAGLIMTAFAPLDFVLLSTIPWFWATWLVLALQANLVVSLWSWRDLPNSHYAHLWTLRALYGLMVGLYRKLRAKLFRQPPATYSSAYGL